MKRLILSLAVLFSMFFLAESAFAEASYSCDSSSTITQVEVPIPGTHCVAIIRFCCKPHIETWYLVEYHLLSINIEGAGDCIDETSNLSDEFWQSVRDSILNNGCNNQVIVQPCDQLPWATQVTFFNTSCYSVSWNKHTQRLIYDYSNCDMDAKCETTYSYCREKDGTVHLQIESERSNVGKCPIFEDMLGGLTLHEYLVKHIDDDEINIPCGMGLCSNF